MQGFNIDRIKGRLAGHQTMLISEGYEFRESMINFIVVDKKPRYDINDELVKKRVCQFLMSSFSWLLKQRKTGRTFLILPVKR
jgi:hypothetical protein